jgi:hypothetical protein
MVDRWALKLSTKYCEICSAIAAVLNRAGSWRCDEHEVSEPAPQPTRHEEP